MGDSLYDDKPEQDAPAPKPDAVAETGEIKLRVVGLLFHRSFTSGDVTVTREGTDVPLAQAQQLINDARKHGIQLEVVS